MSVPFSMRNPEALKHVIKGYVDKVELKYSTCAFQVKDGNDVSSLKMYLTIKDSPLIKEYVLNEAIRMMVSERPEVDNLALLEARYDLKREYGIKK